MNVISKHCREIEKLRNTNLEKGEGDITEYRIPEEEFHELKNAMHEYMITTGDKYRTRNNTKGALLLLHVPVIPFKPTTEAVQRC